MKRWLIFLLALVSYLWGGGIFWLKGLDSRVFSPAPAAAEARIVKLPPPQYQGRVSVEEAIFKRRSVRRYRDAPLTLQEVSQLLWAAGGITIDGVTAATRAYPSAGGAYPLEIYLIVGNIRDLSPGIYHYHGKRHELVLLKRGDFRQELATAAWGQDMPEKAPVSLVFTAVYFRTTQRYHQRGAVRYVPMDAGHAGENVHLQAEALGLGTVVIGAFNDEAIKRLLGRKTEVPLYIMPVGRKRQ